jgi:hypothetical protein
MFDPESVVFSLPDEGYWLPTYNSVAQSLPYDVRERLTSVVISYLMAYNHEEVRTRLNGRTVAQILEQYEPPPQQAVVKSGEVDGVQYTLYAPPTDQVTGSPHRVNE